LAQDRVVAGAFLKWPSACFRPKMAGGSRPTSRDMTRFRLILADPQIGGGSVMQTVKLVRPLESAQVITYLQQSPGFQFDGLCQLRGVSDYSQLSMVGIDGAKRTPLHSDSEIENFLDNLQMTKIPAIEVHMPRSKTAAAPAEAVDGGRKRGREARDQVEELEDSNFQLTTAFTKVERRLAELERMVNNNDQRNQRVITEASREMMTTLDNTVTDINAKVQELKDDDQEILRVVDVVRQHGFAVEKQDEEHHQEVQQLLDAFGNRVDTQFEDANKELDKCRAEDERLDAEAIATKEDHKQQLEAHLEELQRLEETKVNEDKWKKGEDALSARITQELSDLDTKLSGALANLDGRFNNEKQLTEERFTQEMSERKQQDEAIQKQLNETTARLEEALSRLNTDTQASLEEAKASLEAVRNELAKSIQEKVTDLSTSTTKRFEEMAENVRNKDKKITERTDELTAKTESTFKSMLERLEEMARQERARLGQVEREIQETSTKIRSDCRADVERVRTDHEQDAARLDADLADLHMKHDVTKQEINFFQSKLKEQRDWTERQLSENSTATRAAAVDSQEGLAATTKMLTALRDDAVGFREKMAKYISLLQHSSDTQGDAINALEVQRGRIRTELDALVGDHKSYTSDMDGWAEDVRLKVERLFRALEPARVEWRVSRASQRAKELKKPLSLRSPGFGIKGIREGHLEFFPDGHNNSPDGKAVLRLFLPPQAHIRYQCWVGRFSDGAREHYPGDNLSVDLLVDDWKDQIGDDGAIPVVMEVLRDYGNDDASLAREMRIESA